jgi:transcriptional repressor NrdR
MKCPFCHFDNDRVVDSRASQDGYVIRRRRECLHCKRRYTTFERLEEVTIKVIKKDGSRAPFQREKIKRGLETACWKRPVSDEQIDAVVTYVEQEINARLDGEIDSREVGEMVMERLRELDQVAYVRFASVYRDFTDAQDFVREVAPMLEDRRGAAASVAAASVEPSGRRADDRGDKVTR